MKKFNKGSRYQSVQFATLSVIFLTFMLILPFFPKKVITSPYRIFNIGYYKANFIVPSKYKYLNEYFEGLGYFSDCYHYTHHICHKINPKQTKYLNNDGNNIQNKKKDKFFTFAYAREIDNVHVLYDIGKYYVIYKAQYFNNHGTKHIINIRIAEIPKNEVIVYKIM